MWGDFGELGPEYEGLDYEQLRGVDRLKDGILSYYNAVVPKNQGLTAKQKRAMLFKMLKQTIKKIEENPNSLDVNLDYEWIEGEK